MEDKILQLAKKLKALADRGIGGEKQNAAAMLKALMEKHGITEDAISENDVSEHIFLLEDKDRRFWKQVVASVLGNKYQLFTFPHDRKTRKKLKRYVILCTPAEAIEIEAKYDFFSKALATEMQLFYDAFIQTNHLYSNPDKTKPDLDEPEMSKEELERLRRMLQLMRAMQQHHFAKQITNTKN